jgi:hypothetical protein
MKKLLCLAVFAAILGAAVGCDDKKSTPPKTPNTTGGAGGTPTKTT